MWWSSSSGEIELNITKKDAHIGHHTGLCDQDIEYLLTKPYIRRQMEKINTLTLRKVLYQYGSWDTQECSEDTQNLRRILWIACGDIVDENI